MMKANIDIKYDLKARRGRSFIASLTVTGLPKGVKKTKLSWESDDADLLMRFKKAFNAGKMHSGIIIEKGGGVTYEGRYIAPFKYATVEWTTFPMLKYLNSDLKKLGF